MKRFIALALVVVAMLALAAVPAFAEGYNDGGWNFTTSSDLAGYGDNAGLYVRTPQTTDQISSVSGPHGGYTTSTNKCQDCHSTHYAKGDYMLLRANKREDACAFCHGGGGGSTINIQMDNAYDTNGAVTGGDRGMGTGHTLGYSGNAPADIQPAYAATGGFACFDCHTPHGNSARILTTFANPGRAYFEIAGVAGSDKFVKTIGVANATNSGAKYNADDYAIGAAVAIGGTSFTVLDGAAYNIGNYFNLAAGSNPTSSLYGVTPVEGNLPVRPANAGAAVKPVWPTGRFLLLKDPHSTAAEGQSDVATSGVDATPRTLTDVAYPVAEGGFNKLAINWEDPLGPADAAYGGNQDLDKNTQATVAYPASAQGILSVSEFCTDCHDGAAGASGQPASAWVPSEDDSSTGTYEDVYSHDAQPRH
ncbi:MAG: cytochrome c3 family protein [Coriobacteriia bacterium]